MTSEADDLRHIGKIKAVFKNGTYAFIDRTTVSAEDDPGNHFLASVTAEDIFLHMEDGEKILYVGMEVSFDVAPDERRGGNTFRAVRAKKTAACRLKELSEGGIRLFVRTADGSQELQDGGAFLTWQTSDELAEVVRKNTRYGDDVRLLLVSMPIGKLDSKGRQVEHRSLIRLDDGMMSIGFDRPGRHRFIGLLVFGNKHTHLESTFLKWYQGRWETTVVDNETTGIALTENNRLWSGSGTIDVEIPKGVFAKERWDSWWVNLSFDSKPPRDSCRYNWRRSFAYTIQPLFVLVATVLALLRWMFFLLLTTTLVLAGARNINWGFFKNLAFDTLKMGDIMSDVRWPTLRLKVRSARFNIPVYATPAMVLFAILVAWIGTWGSSEKVAVAGELIFVLKFTMVMLIALSSIGLIRSRLGRLADKTSSEKRKEEEHQRATAADALARAARSIPISDVRKLPLRISTVRFHYAALKQRVCKPFAT